MKISLQDFHLIFQILQYANENIANDYVNKLEKVDNYIKQSKTKNSVEWLLSKSDS